MGRTRFPGLVVVVLATVLITGACGQEQQAADEDEREELPLEDVNTEDGGATVEVATDETAAQAGTRLEFTSATGEITGAVEGTLVEDPAKPSLATIREDGGITAFGLFFRVDAGDATLHVVGEGDIEPGIPYTAGENRGDAAVVNVEFSPTGGEPGPADNPSTCTVSFDAFEAEGISGRAACEDDDFVAVFTARPE